MQRRPRHRAVGFLVAIALLVAMAAISASTALSRSAKSEIAVTLGKPGELNMKVNATSANAGEVAFVVKNKGKLEHEFVLLRTKTPAAKLPAGDEANTVSERGFTAELDGIEPSRTVAMVLSLKKGHYVLLCNIEGHYAAGMRSDLTLR